MSTPGYYRDIMNSILKENDYVDHDKFDSKTLLARRIQRFLQTGKGFTNIDHISSRNDFQTSAFITFKQTIDCVTSIFYNAENSFIDLTFDHDVCNDYGLSRLSWANVSKKHNLLRELAQLGFSWNEFPNIETDYEQYHTIDGTEIRIYWFDLENQILIKGKKNIYT